MSYACLSEVVSTAIHETLSSHIERVVFFARCKIWTILVSQNWSSIKLRHASTEIVMSEQWPSKSARIC